MAATGSSAGQVTFVSVKSGQSVLPFEHGEPVEHVQFSASSKYMAAAGRSKVSIWKLQTKSTEPTMEARIKGGIRSLSFDSAQQRLALVSEDGRIFDWGLSRSVDAPPPVEVALDTGSAPVGDSRIRKLRFFETSDAAMAR